MENQTILQHIDYTILKAITSEADIIKLCEVAIEYQTASVCIPPSYVSFVKERYHDQLSICTVIGFPLGYNTPATKVFETQEALAQGADEIDVVINLGDVKNKRFDLVERELKAIRDVVGSKILKVIVETCYLEDDELIELTKIVSRVEADHIKTSTGFGSAGAQVKHVQLMLEHKSEALKIKASGGIRSKSDMETYINLGVDRLGLSSIEELK
jgi:deoxyribose-phosphate aldolase